jgi:hypothetical protein
LGGYGSGISFQVRFFKSHIETPNRSFRLLSTILLSQAWTKNLSYD